MSDNQPIIDPLTGAYSRALLAPRLAEELARAARSSTGCALFLFDVDYFKSVNDAYGHARGDDVLCEIVARVTKLIRGYDVLFRYGGDEFVLLLPDTAQADAVRVALRLTDGMRGTPFPGEPPLTVSVSLGVAVFPDDATDAEELLACADRRNYLAKQRGRACAVADDAESESRPASSRLLERDIALSAVHYFLTRLSADGGGALRVVGEPGAGHTRFLEEAARAAKLRGYVVVEPASDVPDPADDHFGYLVLADRENAVAAAQLARQLAERPDAGTVGAVYAANEPGEKLPGEPLTVLDTVELMPWSPSALKIWVRTALHAEPSPPLVEWLAGRTGGLPARVARELERLQGSGGLVRDGAAITLAPALLAKPARQRSRLPVPMTELVGRQQETAQVAQLLAHRRLVTLVGPGGIGKTRLSLAVAGAVADSYDDGAVFVPLADATTPALVAAAVASALEIPEAPGQPVADTVTEHLAERSLLLVLDNFEQVLVAAPLVSQLLKGAPGVTVLASSRERLNLYGEQVYRVPPLSLPDPETLELGAEGLSQAVASSPALALFNARAREAAYDFTLTATNLDDVVELCRRLDGLPLAIELAAARCDTLSPAEMLDQLAERLDVLGEGPRDLPNRQQSLRGAIDWSYDLLDPPAQALFVRLGAFAGGCGLDAVAALDLDDPDADGLDGLEKRLGCLVDKSLLRAEPHADGVRYAMLETIRGYAVERLAQSADADAVTRRHAGYFAGLAERAGQELVGPEQARWAARVEREYQNLRAAFGRALDGVAFGRALDGADPATGARICLGLWRFWRTGSNIGEGREWLGRLLDGEPLPERTHAQVLHAAAVLAGAQDDHSHAAALAAESLRRARAAGDAQTAAQASNAQGIAALAAGDYPAAREYFAESLATWQELDAALGMAIAHGNLTRVALRTGDIETASEHAARCLELDRRQGNTRGIMLGLLCLGEIGLARGDTADAQTRLTEALELGRGLGDVFGEAMALHQLGQAARLDGDEPEAVRLIGAGLSLRRDVGDREDLAISLEVLADLLAASDPLLSARMLGAADGLRTRHRLPAPADGGVERAATLAGLGARLGGDGLAAVLTAGQSQALDAVVDEALARVGIR